MAPKGRALFFLLIVTCTAVAKPPGGRPGKKPNCNDMATKLMRSCLKKGYPAPEEMQLKALFNDSDLPVADEDTKQSDTPLSTYLKIQRSVCPEKANKEPQDDEKANKMCKVRHLLAMIKLMRNSSAASVCHMQAFVAPQALEALSSQRDMTVEEYDTLQRAAKPVLKDMPFKGMDPPPNLDLKMMMEMVKEEHGTMSQEKRVRVFKWLKELIAQRNFNCTRRPPSTSRSTSLKPCKSLLPWLNLTTLGMIGPYVSLLDTSDVDSAPKEQLCEYVCSGQFRSATSMSLKMNSRLGKKLLGEFRECFNKTEFTENMDKFGILLCYYSSAPDLTPDLSTKLLSELNKRGDCRNPNIKQLKKRLVKSLMSKINGNETLQALKALGRSIAFLSPKELSKVPAEVLKKVLKKLGSTIPWTRSQLHALVKNMLGDKCKVVSGKELMDFESFVDGLPNCVLKHVKEMLKDPESLKKITRRMRKRQLMALLQGPLKNEDPSQLWKKLFGPLLHTFPLDKLKKANITSWDQAVMKIWTRSQAAFLVKKLYNPKKPWYRYGKLGSLLQGVTCKMIDRVADSDTQDMVQDITETPQWLSKLQAGCAARKLFATLEKETPDFFKTKEGMEKIPPSLVPHLPPSKVKDLTDDVCPVFLDKMEEADLSLLPLRSPSRPALVERALLCLAQLQGTNVSGLAYEDVLLLGPLSCELQRSQLLLLAPDVLSSVLQDMAGCQYIPRHHRAEIIQLVKDTFGDPSVWTAETLEAVGLLLFYDDDAISALPNKPWVKDVLYDLRSGPHHDSVALRKKCFDLTTTDSNGDVKQPTVELIEELEMDNVFWTAEQLATMSPEIFLAAVEILGDIYGWRADQLAVLIKKAIETLGPVSEMTEIEVTQLGCIARGFSNTDLEKLPFSLDILDTIANCGWNESQMMSVWKADAKYDKVAAQQLGAEALVALSSFINGLNSGEIEQLNKDAFKNAVGSIGDVQFSPRVRKLLKSLAVSVFGNPSTWSEAQVCDLGNIMAGLDTPEMVSLDPSVFSCFSESSIPLILPTSLAALSEDQLEGLGPNNAASVTNDQRAALRANQRAALERAETGTPVKKQTSGHSGAPSLSVEGISAFMKPLLFLLMGFLLL